MLDSSKAHSRQKELIDRRKSHYDAIIAKAISSNFDDYYFKKVGTWEDQLRLTHICEGVWVMRHKTSQGFLNILERRWLWYKNGWQDWY